MAPIISGLDLIWRNNIDIIALTTDELQDKEKSDLRNEPNYYWNGLIPQTIILNSDGEVKYDKNGMINIDELNKVIGELKGIDIEDTTFSVESFNEYNSIISEKKIKTKLIKKMILINILLVLLIFLILSDLYIKNSPKSKLNLVPINYKIKKRMV